MVNLADKLVDSANLVTRQPLVRSFYGVGGQLDGDETNGVVYYCLVKSGESVYWGLVEYTRVW